MHRRVRGWHRVQRTWLLVAVLGTGFSCGAVSRPTSEARFHNDRVVEAESAGEPCPNVQLHLRKDKRLTFRSLENAISRESLSPLNLLFPGHQADGVEAIPPCAEVAMREASSQQVILCGGAQEPEIDKPHVAVLENVFVDSEGQVFNASHRFVFGGWTGTEKNAEDVEYAPGTHVLQVEELVNIAIDPMAGTSRHHLHEIVHRLPLFLRLAPFMPGIHDAGTPFFLGAHKVLWQSLGKILGIAPWKNQLKLPYNRCSLLFAKRLIQPIHDDIEGPRSQQFWQHLRATFLLHPSGTPLFNPDWTLRQPASVPSEDTENTAGALGIEETSSSDYSSRGSTGVPQEDDTNGKPGADMAPEPSAGAAGQEDSFPKDWAAVVSMHPASLPVLFTNRKLEPFPWINLDSMFSAEFWLDRVVILRDMNSHDRVISLFQRTAVLATSPGSPLSYLPFMRPGSVLVLLNPISEAGKQSTPAEDDGQHESLVALAQSLAKVFRIRLLEVNCKRVLRMLEGASGNLEPGSEDSEVAPAQLVQCEHGHVEAAMSKAASLLYNSPLFSGYTRRQRLKTSLPGTRFKTERAVEDFTAWSSCITEQGRWRRDPLPRKVPWGRTEWADPGSCDEPFLRGKRANAVAESVADIVSKIDDAKSRGEGQVLTPEEMERLEKAKEEWTVREGLRYHWDVPKEACAGPSGDIPPKSGETWEAFDPYNFCQSLPGERRLVVVGDSINDQFELALAHNLVRDVPYPEDPDSKVNEIDFSRVVENNVPVECLSFMQHSGDLSSVQFRASCVRSQFRVWSNGSGGGGGGVLGMSAGGGNSSCTMELVFIRNERLRLGIEGIEERALDNLPFHTELRRLVDTADVLLLNRGAHPAPNDMFERRVLAVSRLLRERYPEKLIIWRNTPPGHIDCTHYDKPLKKQSLQKPEGTDFAAKKYNWELFEQQNQIVRRISRQVGFILMDVYSLSILRADGHRGRKTNHNGKQVMDCLHYCQPGPLDSWVELLYNLIRVAAPQS